VVVLLRGWAVAGVELAMIYRARFRI